MDLSVRARHATVALAEGTRWVGFAEGDEDEPYALFAQGSKGGPVRFEVNDPLFSAENAVTRVTATPQGLTIAVDPARAPALGYARTVTVHLPEGAEGRDAALAALARMLGDRLVTG